MRLSVVTIAIVLTFLTTNIPPKHSQASSVDTNVKIDNIYKKEEIKFPDRTIEYNTAKQADIARLEAARIAEAQKVVQVPTQPQTAVVAPAGDIQSIIVKWAGHYNTDAGQLLRVANCESHYNVNAYNPSGATGLFQFMPGTFLGNARRVGLANPDIHNAEHQAQVAAYMFSIGQARQWVCK